MYTVQETDPKIIRYRRQVRVLSGVFNYLSIFLIFLGLLLLTCLQLIREEHFSYTLAQFLALKSLVVGFFLFLKTHLFLIPMSQSEYRISKDSILIIRGKKERLVYFSDVERIEHSIHSFLVGSFKLHLKNAEKVKFTVVLERADYIVDALKEYRPDLLSPEEYAVLRQKIILADHSWARIYDYFKIYKLYTLLALVVIPILSFCLMTFKQTEMIHVQSRFLYFFKTLSLVYVAVFLFGLVFYVCTNYLALRKMRKSLSQDPNKKQRDMLFEKRMYHVAYPLYIGLLVLFYVAIFQTDMNLLGRVRSAINFKSLGIEVGDFLWLDSKFNCLNCGFSLRKGDLVYLKLEGGELEAKKVLGQIVGLPLDYVKVNKRDERDRYVASLEEKVVPIDYLAVQVGEGKIFTLIPIQKIEGKVFKNLFDRSWK